MPSPRTHRKVTEERNRKQPKSPEKSTSFHGHFSGGISSSAELLLRRPRTVPEMFAGGGFPAPAKLTKLLLNVTVERSVGAVHVLISLDSTAENLIAAALRQYDKEGRRPVLCSGDAADYDLHYSQFSLESLAREEKLMALGSRNFFLCLRNGDVTTSSLSCAEQADTISTKIALPWVKFMDILL